MSVCGQCQASLQSESKFCGQCGKSVVASATSEIEQERKFVTVLFADIHGFTSMSERLDPEEVTEIIGTCFQRLGPVIQKFEGTIDKFMGDSVMALFGAPFAHENDAERTIACCLEMLKELNALNKEKKYDLKMSMGINSGIVIAGGLGAEGKIDYTVMGDAVNVAQRLQKAAPASQIYVSRNVYKATQQAFEFKTLEPLMLKGKSSPVECFSVVGQRDSTERREGIHKGYSKLVGRDREISTLSKALENISNQSSGFVIVGDAGSGKSRLVHEVKKLSLQKGIHWLSTNPPSTTKDSPLGSFIRLIRYHQASYPESALSEDPIEDTLLKQILENEAPRLFSDMKDADARKQTTFAAIINWLSRLIEATPATVVFENADRMDPLSIELCLEIAKSKPKRNLLLLLSVRPEQNPFFSDGISLPQMKLQSLSVSASLDLTRYLLELDTLPRNLEKLVSSRGDGNPLYIEELIKSLIDSKQIVFDKNRWIVSEDLSESEIPENLHSLVAHRIDALDSASKKLLQLASVAGRTFDDKLLEATGLGPENLFQVLRVLRKKEFIFEYDVSEDRVQYIFKHALTRDVAYETLLQKTRRHYHTEIGNFIESSSDCQENRLETLAHHFLHSKTPLRSVVYLQLCGQKNESIFDNKRAIQYYDDALRISRTAPADNIEMKSKVYDLTQMLAYVHQHCGRFDRAESLLMSLLNQNDCLEPTANLAQTYRKIGELNSFRGNTTTAFEWLEKSLRIAEQINDMNQQVRTCKALGNTYKATQDYDSALEYLNRGIAGIQKVKDARLEANFWNDLSAVYLEAGNYQRALECLNLCDSLCEMIGDMKFTQLYASINHGALLYFMKDSAGAIKKWQASCRMAQEIGAPLKLRLAQHNIGEVELERGNYEAALQAFNECLELASRFGFERVRVKEMAYKSRALVGLKKLTEAEPILADSRKQAEDLKLWKEYTTSSLYLSEVYSKKGEDTKARDLLYETQTKLKVEKLSELEKEVQNYRESSIKLKNSI